MNGKVIFDLIREMFTEPRSAAARAIHFGLPSRTLWMMMILLTVIASLLSSLSLHGVTIPDPILAQLVTRTIAYQAPMIYAFLQVCQTGLGIFAVFYVGRLLAGQGTVPDVLAAMILLQAAAISLIVAITVVGMLIPAVGTIGLIGFVGWCIWAMSSAVDAAHRLNSIGKALLVTLMASAVTLVVSAIVLRFLVPVSLDEVL